MLKIILYIKGRHSLIFKRSVTRSLLGSDIDVVFCYQIALWMSGECEIVGRTHTLSLYSTADIYSSSFRQGACRETAIASRLETQHICKFFEGLLRHSVLTPKTVGAAVVEDFAVILPAEATTPLVDAPPDIGSEHGVCNV